jgi:hypothetical protein
LLRDRCMVEYLLQKAYPATQALLGAFTWLSVSVGIREHLNRLRG